jgi:NitT/TauT family transport system substrate-binding protein
MLRNASRRAVMAAGGAALVAPFISRLGAQPLTPIRLTAGANLGYAPQYVAEGTDIFRRHGIDGRTILFDVGFQGTEAVIAGQAETSGTVEFPMVNLLARGADLVVPAISITADDLKIVALTSIRQAQDLVGKRVGYINGSSAHYAFDRYLRHFNIPREQLTHVSVPAAEQVALMARGSLDAYVWVEPVVSRGLDVMQGRAHVLTPGIEVAYTTRTYLQMSRAWAERNADAVVRLLRALIEAKNFIAAEPRRTAEICARKLNLPADQVPELLRRGGWRWDIYLERAALDTFNEVMGWMRDNNRLTGNAPDIARVFQPQYLRQIDPALVRGF